MGKTEKKYYGKVFLINLIAGIFSFAWAIFSQKGLFSLAGDFDVQQIPFAMYANDAIKSGNVVWDWSLDLGTNFLGGMSFYILGNPSFWLSMLFPSKYFMYVVGWIYVLKYAVAGLTSFAYMKRYVKDPDSAVIASMFYAFSGFMNEDLLFYHFHDVVALFPLMLMALDGLVLEKKRGPFIFAVFINAVTNYYFLIGEAIFLAGYYVFRFLVPLKKKALRPLLIALWEAVLGCVVGALLLLPSFLFVIQNPRVKNDYLGSNSLVFSEERYLYILKGLLFPGEIMSDQSAVISHNFSSCGAYLPMVGLVLVIAFFYLHKQHWLKNMLKFCLVMAVVPVLNASFSLFAGLYHRWYYMPVMMMALASAMVLDSWQAEGDRREQCAEKTADIRCRERILASVPEGISPEEAVKTAAALDDEIPEIRAEEIRREIKKPTAPERAIQKGAITWALVAIGFICFLVFVKWSDSEPSKIYRADVFALWSAVCLTGIFLTWLVLVKLRRNARLFFALLLCFYSVFTTVCAIFLLQLAHSEDSVHLYDELMTSRKIQYDTPEYRFTNTENTDTLTNGYPQISNFCSTVSGSIFRFYESLGLERDVRSPEAPAGLTELVSAKYTIEDKRRDAGEPIQTVQGDYTTLYVYQNESVAPIGFTYDTYMTASEFALTNEDDRCILMLKTLVVPDDKAEEVSKRLRHYDKNTDGAATQEYLNAISAAHIAESSTDVRETTDSYASTITAAKDTYAFFSIPNDSGWTAYVNGEKTEILDINGFMAVPVSAGSNRIVFRYETPGWKTGCILSAAGVAVTMIYLVMVRRKRKKAARLA